LLISFCDAELAALAGGTKDTAANTAVTTPATKRFMPTLYSYSLQVPLRTVRLKSCEPLKKERRIRAEF
jgi:hypothetical protein